MTCALPKLPRQPIPLGFSDLTVLAAPGETVVLLDPRVREVLTVNAETDATSALTRGLAEYLASLAAPVAESPDEGLLFRRVVDTWADVEQNAEYPAAAVYSADLGTYDEERCTPETIDLDTPAGDVLRHVSELVTTLTVEVYATDRVERVRLVHALERALCPTDWMVGVRLALPHYHGAHAAFRFESVQYFDDEQNAQVRRRRATLTVNAGTSVYVASRAPVMRPRARIESVQ